MESRRKAFLLDRPPNAISRGGASPGKKSFRTRAPARQDESQGRPACMPAASVPDNRETAQPPTKATQQGQSQSLLQGALALLTALLPSSGHGPGRDSCLHSRQLHPGRVTWPSQSLAVKGDEIRRRLHCSDSSTRQPLIVARVVVCCKDASSRRTFQFSTCAVCVRVLRRNEIF